jgi:hypothetical protein
VSPILRLLDTLSTPPRGAGPGPVWLAVLYHLANLTITVCYLAIPGIVLYYWRYRREGISPRALWMVLAFLPVQALSRLVRVDGISFSVVATLDVLAAIVTVNSVYWLRPKILHILRLPSRDELHRAKDALQSEVMKVHTLHLEEKERVARLLAEVERLKRAPPDPSDRSWLSAKHKALDRIAEVIKQGG